MLPLRSESTARNTKRSRDRVLESGTAEEAKEGGDPNVETAEAGVSLLERSGTRNISWSATAAATAAAVSFRASEAVVTALLADAS